MTETSQGRHSTTTKGDFTGSFSDADSGYDDLGVITIPVVRTVFRNDPNGRKISTTSTEFISIQKNNGKGDSGPIHSNENISSSGGSPNSLSCSSTPIQSPKHRSSRIRRKGDSGVLNQSNSSLEFINESGISSDSIFTMNSFDSEEFDISHFNKEYKKEAESERKFRFLSSPRDERGRPRPVIRNIATTKSTVHKEEVTRRIPRKKGRSKSADSRRTPKGPQSLFSPTYSKILSPETMRNRKMWADIVKKDCILEEEYYKIPYEECNREIIFGRLCSSETLLNNFRRLKNESMKPREVVNSSEKNTTAKNCPYKKLSKKQLRDQFLFNVDPYNSQKNPESINKTNLNDVVNTEANSKMENTNSTTDQIQQLIDDLNKIAYSSSNCIPKGSYSDSNQIFVPYCSDDKIPGDLSNKNPVDSNFNNLVYLNQNIAIDNSVGNDKKQKTNEERVEQARVKKKKSKSVSFSNENKELIFDSFSDSDSSGNVFEDQNVGRPVTPVNPSTVKCSSFDATLYPNISLKNILSSDFGTSVDDDETNVDYDETPVDYDETPVDYDETPVDYDETPVDYDETPVDYDETPVDYDETPVDYDETPVDDNETPQDIQPACVWSAGRETRHKLDNSLPFLTPERGAESLTLRVRTSPFLHGLENGVDERKENDNETPVDDDEISDSYYSNNFSNGVSTLASDSCSPTHQEVKSNIGSQNVKLPTLNTKKNSSVLDEMNEYNKNIHGSSQANSINKMKENFLNGTEIYNRHPNSLKGENIDNRKKTTPNNFRGDKVNIYMTRGASFTEHQIELLTRMNSQSPRISITRLKVPFSSIKDQWDWIQSVKKQHDSITETRKDDFPNYIQSTQPYSLENISPTSASRIANIITENTRTCVSEFFPKAVKGTFQTSL